MSNENIERKITDSFRILHRMGRPIGLSCYTLPTVDEKPVIKVTTLDVVLFISMFSVNVYLTYYNYRFWETVSIIHKRDTLFNTGIKLISTGSLLLTLIGAVVVFVVRERIWHIVLTLEDINEKANTYDKIFESGKNHKYFSYYLLFSVVTVYSIFITYSAYVSIYVAHFDPLYLISFVKANATFAYMCLKFQFLIFAVGMRFVRLNRIFEKRISAAIAVENPQLIGDLIFVVGDFHDTLNSLAKKINYYFAIMILPIYGGNFTITVFCSHNLYKTYIQNDSTFYYLALLLLALAIYFNILIVFITLGSEWTIKMANKLGILVHKATTTTQNKFILQRLNILSQQVLHISPTFSCGLFAMDWPMQFTFVSALASYLIILMQFQNYVNE